MSYVGITQWAARLGIAAVVTMAATPATADVVTDWNAITFAVANAGGRPAPAIMLDMTMAQLAVHDAVQAYHGRYETYGPPALDAAGSPIAAVATAARDVLVNRFPAQMATIDTTYQDYLSAQGLSTADPGVQVGRTAAMTIMALRATDGAYPPNPEVFTGGTAVGQWRPTPPALAPMSAPWFGSVTPFAPKNVRRLLRRMPPHPKLTGGVYARDYQEVKAMGARVGSARTAEETDLAYFYSDNFFGQMNRIARTVAEAQFTDIADSARLLALANMAATDALIAVWRVKREDPTWRPSTAIQEGDTDDNPWTLGDPTWQPLVSNPSYPEYPSGANTITAAFMRTLEHIVGDGKVTFNVTSAVPQVVQKTRTYSRFSHVAQDVVNARIYQGIHFRTADKVARRHGERSADWTVSHVLRPLK